MSRYADIGELRRYLGFSDASNDAELQRALDAAEAEVEAFCGRRFWKDAAPTARVYRSFVPSPLLEVDDLVSVSAVARDDDDDGTFETAVPAADYYLAPQDRDASVWPYRWIVLRRGKLWPAGVAVQVTAVYGWPAVPAAVKQAVLMQAARLVKRGTDAPLGIAVVGMEGTGVRLSSRLDPDAEQLLRAYVRMGA